MVVQVEIIDSDKEQLNSRWAEREMVVGLAFLTVLILFSTLFSVTVGTGPQAPLLSHAAAPWIFGPIQVLLLYLPPVEAALIFPGIFLGFLFLFPWLSRGRGNRVVPFLFALLSGVLLFLLAMYIWIE